MMMMAVSSMKMANNPHAKEYLLGWIIAVVVIMVAFLII